MSLTAKSQTPAISKNDVGSLPNGSHAAVDVVLDTAYQGIDQKSWKKLFANARTIGIPEFITDMFAGKHINQSEDRPALHSALRNLSKTPVMLHGQDVMPSVTNVSIYVQEYLVMKKLRTFL